jgi:hypothetical protein
MYKCLYREAVPSGLARSKLIQEIRKCCLFVPLQFTIEGILGSQRPAKDDSEAREEAEKPVSYMPVVKSECM